MSNFDEAAYMRALIQKAQEFVEPPTQKQVPEAPASGKKEKAKRNISEERKEELRQRMIKLREKSLVTRQAKAKAKKQPAQEVTPAKEENKTEPPKVDTPKVDTPKVVEVAPVVTTTQPKAPEKVYPKYFLPSMSFAKKHGFF
jgi:hypothetical protein